ncbi:MAG: sensor domain-containing diguanylate cyclase [Planctomycetota bacterium]|jgi:diguanylate cyclase (GGDEF)-like protein
MSGQDATSLLARLKATGRLPSPAGVALRVLELCRCEDSDIQEIADTIMADPALAGRLLRYANSAAVGAAHEVKSVREAVLLMGLRAVKLTALGFSLAVPESKPRCPGFDFKCFWIESFITAVIARHLAAGHFKVDREESFTAGLLAGMGRLALAHGLPEKYNEILEAAAGDRPLEEVEREALGVDHREFGAQLLADWRLPEVLVNGVKHQGRPEKAPRGAQALARTILAAGRLTPLFVAGGLRRARPQELAAARDIVENTLKLDKETWKRTTDQILSDYQQVIEIFEFEFDGEVSVLGLYAEAQEEASRVGIVAQLEQNRTLETNKELLRRATTDALTGIANRAKFDDRLDEAIKGLRRGHGDLVLILFDIDHFKKFNDTYGHEVGDLVLKRVARVAETSLREVDLVARYGGEEFAVLAPHTDARGACTIAARLRMRMAGLSVDVNGEKLSVTVSVGLVVTSDYPTPPTAEQLVREADEQLYLSKKNGRNTWSYRGRTATRDAGADRSQSGAA